MTLDLKLKPYAPLPKLTDLFSINSNKEENVAILWNGMQSTELESWVLHMQGKLSTPSYNPRPACFLNEPLTPTEPQNQGNNPHLVA